MTAWRWNILPAIAAAAFAEKPDEPLPIWASKHVFLDRRITTRPGYYDPDEYAWTWEFQEIIRTRHICEKELDDGAVVIVDPGTEGATCTRVHQVDAMKSTQTGLTEAALNGVRYIAKHDPQNVIFAIDNRTQAGEVNEIRLQPTLRKLGTDVMPADDDDAGKFLIKMRRLLIYFLGSYSSGAFAQKMCELGINDELEEHGTDNSVEDLKSRMKTSARRLLVNISRPKKIVRNTDGKVTGGPIAKEWVNGSQHEPEVPCPHCTEAAHAKRMEEFRNQETRKEGDENCALKTSNSSISKSASREQGSPSGPLRSNENGSASDAAPTFDPDRAVIEPGEAVPVPGFLASKLEPIPCGYQQLLQENMKFGHCKNVLNEWDFERVLNETWFECVHCHQPIEERWKRWMNDRKRRRWRRTNFNAEPNHISFHFSDFLSYDDSVRWGRLAIKWIQSKGDKAKRDSYKCDHEGLPVEVEETKTEISSLLELRGSYKRGQIPWLPRALMLISDVGLEYVKWGALAFRNEGEAALIDWGKGLHPDDIAMLVLKQKYLCLETGKSYGISLGLMDAKYRKIEVHKACLRVPRRLFPSAGVRAGLSMRSISFNRPPHRPKWFGVIVYNDDDAKSELYIERIGAWSKYLKQEKTPLDLRATDVPKPFTPRLWLPEDVKYNDRYVPGDGITDNNLLPEFTREALTEQKNGRLEWKRRGANEGGDIVKVGCVGWRFFTLLETGELDLTKPAAEEQAAAEIQAAIAAE